MKVKIGERAHEREMISCCSCDRYLLHAACRCNPRHALLRVICLMAADWLLMGILYYSLLVVALASNGGSDMELSYPSEGSAGGRKEEGAPKR